MNQPPPATHVLCWMCEFWDPLAEEVFDSWSPLPGMRDEAKVGDCQLFRAAVGHSKPTRADQYCDHAQFKSAANGRIFFRKVTSRDQDDRPG